VIRTLLPALYEALPPDLKVRGMGMAKRIFKGVGKYSVFLLLNGLGGIVVASIVRCRDHTSPCQRGCGSGSLKR
jgi:hypothetical protein